MISKLSNQFIKKVAFFLLTVFYCDMVLAAYTGLRSLNRDSIVAGYLVIANRQQFNEKDTPIYMQRAFEKHKIVNDFRKHEGTISDLSIIKKKNNEIEVIEVGGPDQPEMASFKSVGSDNMVDLFSGDFSYNIPLLDAGGYPINLFYKSGISMDQEASWVGLGWNINPGTITRNMRGLPDDFQGAEDTIRQVTSMKVNKTVGVTMGGDLEVFGYPLGTASIGVFHNNYKGWGLEAGLNASLSAGNPSKDVFSGGLSLSLNTNSQEGLTITPGASFSAHLLNNDINSINSSLSTSLSYNTRFGLKNLQVSGGFTFSKKNDPGGLNPDKFSSSLSFAYPSYTPTIKNVYTNRQSSFTGKLGTEFFGVHPNIYVSGYVSSIEIKGADTLQKLPAYGYLNYQAANGNELALLDFNREKDIPYREKPAVPNIGVPAYTYDVFSVSGEGTGGTFRAYRGDIGYIFDHALANKSETEAFSVDVGCCGYFHGGLDFNENNAVSKTSIWKDQNNLASDIAFKNSDSIFEASYFRNPGEKAIINKKYYEDIGGDDVVTPELYQPSTSSSLILATGNLKRYKNTVLTGMSFLSANTYRAKRDKRSQAISYLTAEEASNGGFSRYIENYAVNKWGLRNCNKNIDNAIADTLKINDTLSIEKRVNSFRKKNHISEIDVLNPDGRKYIYGIPVYNLKQKEVSASVAQNRSKLTDGLVAYDIIQDNPITHPDVGSDGRDNYYSKEEIPDYAHSFLLTAIVSPDYADLTGDGISDDDIGDAIKFNYSKVASKANPYGWRTPYVTDSATYDEGLKTDTKDDRASYIYGEKELWYLNSIESKNMIVTFTLEERKDQLPIDETGKKTTLKNTAKRLKEINLYTKADFLKNGQNAIPIKTVHFGYSYTLCYGINKGVTNFNYKVGKLTLDTIYFTYNGNKKKQNIYYFYYNKTNPDYNSKSFDRWGSYKDPAQNPGASNNKPNNAEYPYSIQDSATAGMNAAAWTLDSILLPSKAKIKITYESDDYAFIQNKRAGQMFKIAGMSQQANQLPVLNLYNNTNHDAFTDNLFIYVNVGEAVLTAQDVYAKYLQSIDKLFFKLFVHFPNGYEYVSCYADIDLSGGAGVSYGISSGNNKLIWFKINGINIKDATSGGNYSPLAKAAIQFLRLNLPGQAYPGSEIGDDISVAEAVQMILTLATNVTDAFSSFDDNAMNKGWAKYIDTARSLVRLNTPNYKKYGGGLRVKKIVIYDGWNSMTGQKESKYGQQYYYTTTKEINGKQQLISSGVASYEPSIGGEENPWKQPIEYIEKVSVLAPTALAYTETPLGENFFPAPYVGYSEVRMRSIHIDTVKSANGMEETKFFTTYDFPTFTDNTTLLDNKKRYAPGLANFLKIDARHYVSISQGFKVELNDMNGKMKSQATYPETDFTSAISYSEYFYKTENPQVEFKKLANTVMAINLNGDIDTASLIGKDVELMFDMRQHQSITEGRNIQVNVDVIPALFGVAFPIPSLWYMPQREEDLYHSIAATKVIYRYGILDSIVVIDKGSKISTKNLLFDNETGEVLLTRTQNEFNDPVYNFKYPAHWAYSGMGPAYQNLQAVFTSGNGTNIEIVNGFLQNTNKYPGMQKYFESGDEILVTGYVKLGETIVSDCNGNTQGCPTNVYSEQPSSRILWAVDSKKINPASTNGFLFVERDGTPYSGEMNNLKIIRSGKRNMSMMPIGTVTLLSNPLEIVNNKLSLVLSTNKDIVATGAMVYKDVWKTKDQNFLKDTSTITMQRFRQNYTATVTLKEFAYSNDGDDQPSPIDYLAGTKANSTFAGVSYEWINPSGTCHSKLIKNKSILNFGLGQISKSAIIDTATMNFTSKTPDLNFCNTYYNSSSHSICNTFNWSTATTFYQNLSSSHLKRITTSWTPSSGYYDINTTAMHSVGINYNSYTNLDCKFLIQDVVNDLLGDRGIEFVLDNEETVYSNSQLSYLTFNGAGTNAPSLFISYRAGMPSPFTVCRSAITQRNLNPYVSGIFGNWRPDKSYVYNGNRRQTDATVSTNIRTDGAIKNYNGYWSFSSLFLIPTTDTVTWVWNSQATLFNKKGFELENKDPLGRYNAGSYGYNSSLPLNVTQNSKYREQIFDGLEDYSYDNNSCIDPCPVPRAFDLTKSVGVRDTINAHTGKYSLKLNAGDSMSILVPVINVNKDTVSQKIKGDISTINFQDTIVTPNGNGLRKLLFNDNTASFGNTNNFIVEPTCTLPDTAVISYFGYLQATKTGDYTIKAIINGSNQCDSFPFHAIFRINNLSTDTYSWYDQLYLSIHLVAGELYYVSVDAGDHSYLNSNPNLQWSTCGEDYTSIPLKNLYWTDGTANGTINYTMRNCNNFSGYTTDSSSLITEFSLTKNSKYWFSAWVKEEAPCLTGTYLNNEIYVEFYDANNIQIQKDTAKPKSNIIEYWQRFDQVFLVPDGTIRMVVKLKNKGSSNIYFDDFRILPFNANMKSFVYNPVNLRLMAQLDENNYATYYEYDDDGTLIRVKKETERGIQTINETRSFMVK